MTKRNEEYATEAPPMEATTHEEVSIEQLLEAPPAPARIEGVVIGRLLAVEGDGRARVTWAGCGGDGVSARVFCPLPAEPVGGEVALHFEHGDPHRPVVMGALNTALSVESPSRPQVVADGERLVLSAEREVELRCGDASIVLTRAGKVIIRGAYVHTQASGLHRILGAAVKIN